MADSCLVYMMSLVLRVTLKVMHQSNIWSTLMICNLNINVVMHWMWGGMTGAKDVFQ